MLYSEYSTNYLYSVHVLRHLIISMASGPLCYMGNNHCDRRPLHWCLHKKLSFTYMYVMLYINKIIYGFVWRSKFLCRMWIFSNGLLWMNSRPMYIQYIDQCHIVILLWLLHIMWIDDRSRIAEKYIYVYRFYMHILHNAFYVMYVLRTVCTCVVVCNASDIHTYFR